MKCASIRGANSELRKYSGIRLTADGFDCALPVTIDSHSVCSFECLYCFSDNLLGHQENVQTIGQTSLSTIENIFKDRNMEDPQHWKFKKALRYDKRNSNGYPCPVQLGGLCDAGDTIEQNQGWLLKFMDLAIKYRQPVRMSTKGGIFLIDEYIDKIKEAPELFWVAFSMVTDDDDVMSKVDRGTANASQRIEQMRRLTRAGASVSLRLRPIMPGITDRNGAYKSLIKKAADAGARAISYECMFYPQAIPKANKWKYEELNRITGYDLKKLYSSFGSSQACTRPSYLWTENIMHDIKERAVKEGMSVGVSDPVWKQLTDCGCCCGIPKDDPVFGNWEVENATNALMNAKNNGGLIHLEDITPEWAYKVLLMGIVNLGTGPDILSKRGNTWADYLKDIWNNPSKQRSVMNYFQGALQIDGIDSNGNYVYRYEGLKRQYKKTIWNV
jgi:DNA repair photolyase